jgi:hypothetical protein
MFLVQKSRIGRRTFEIRDGHVEIAWKAEGKNTQIRVPMTDIDPECEELVVRRPYMFIVPLALAVLVTLATRALLVQQTVPKYFAIWTGMCIPLFLWQAFRGLPPVELRRFRNRKGEVVFDVVREKTQARDVDDFIADLRMQIKAIVQ